MENTQESAGTTSALPLVVVVGPTGSGKSDLAIAIAARFSGEIVNCDSLQLYRYLNIGTAKVPPEERCGIPHHLIDLLNPDQLFTAGDYSRVARETLREISSRGGLPVVAGGTGFYLRALLNGLFQGPARDESLRARLARRPERLHRLLTRLDPSSASRIHPNDTNKLIRAIEVCLLARRPMTEMFSDPVEPLQGYRTLKIGLDPDRDELNARINERCHRMFERGLVAEVRHVFAMGFPAESKALESIGYHEVVELLAERMTLQEAMEHTQTATRQYAKRQRTWFRREPGVAWLNGFGNQSKTIEEGIRLVSKFLSEEKIIF